MKTSLSSLFVTTTFLQFCEHFTTGECQIVLSDNGNDSKNPSSFSIPKNYSKGQRPSINGEATQVQVDVHIQAINPIQAAAMDFRYKEDVFMMDVTLIMKWKDDRLQFANEWFYGSDHLILSSQMIDQIWNPDPFVVNAKSTDVGQLAQKLVSVYIYKNHSLQFTVNLFATVACAMNYRFYPYDSQLCPMLIESFSFDESQVKYMWADQNAFTINPKLRMLQFVPRRPLHYDSVSVPRFNEAKNFSQLIAYFRFDRLLGNHLIQTFAPCSLVVCLSWFSFWLELNALSARMALLVTSILTLVTQFVGLKADLPPVAYIKAVDVWMAGCMVWLFGALGEFVLAKVIFSLTEDAKFQFHESYFLRMQQQQQLQKMTVAESPRLVDKEEDNIRSVVQPKLRDKDANLEGKILSGDVVNALSISQYSRRGDFKKKNSFEFDSASHSSTSSASLGKNFGRFHIPLQWTDPMTGATVVLWKRLDNFSKWAFPLTFFIFCTVYWLVLYIHSQLEYEADRYGKDR